MDLPEYEKKKVENFSPQYLDTSFDSQHEFDDWLKANTEIEIIFEDQGQDLMKFYAAASGEIIHTELPQLGRIYNGGLILDNLDLIISGDNISVWVPQFKSVSMFKYMVQNVIRKSNDSNEN